MTTTTTERVAGGGERVPLTRSLIWLLVCAGVLSLIAAALGAANLDLPRTASFFLASVVIGGLPALVLGLLAVRKNATNRPLADRLTRIGWMVCGLLAVLLAVSLLQLWSTTESFQKFWSWEYAAEVLPLLLETFVKTTLLITVVGTVIATLLGLVLAVATESLPRVLTAILHWLMDVVRMTPLIVQLIFVSFLVPSEWSLLWVGTVVIGVHYAMYMAESYIAGIASVDVGQWEAAKSLSLPRGRTWQAIVLPQALRATLPSLGNWAISMFKDTPYLFAIYVVEMVTAAQQYGASTFRYNEALTIAGLIFLVASLITAVAVRRLEKALVY